MSTTTKFDVPIGVWTQVATGSADVTIWSNPAGYRVAVGAAEPDDLTIGVLAGRGTTEGVFQLNGLGVTDNVYLTPVDGRATTAQVIAS